MLPHASVHQAEGDARDRRNVPRKERRMIFRNLCASTWTRILAIAALSLGAATSVRAANLTVCGIVDGSPADPDGLADGRITTSCNLSGGQFTGSVSETETGFDYGFNIGGDFSGSASDASFITGMFGLGGAGDLYPYIQAGQLLGGGLSTNTESLSVTAHATNFVGFPATAQVIPVAIGAPLPLALTDSLGQAQHGNFTGFGLLTISLDYQAAENHVFSFPGPGISVLASTGVVHIIPEPSTLALLGSGLVGLRGRRKWRTFRVRQRKSGTPASPRRPDIDGQVPAYLKIPS
jgi:hypothetical protein